MSGVEASQVQDNAEDAHERWEFLTRWAEPPHADRGDSAHSVVWQLLGRGAALVILAAVGYLPWISADFLDYESGPLAHVLPAGHTWTEHMSAAFRARLQPHSRPTPLMQTLLSNESPIGSSAVCYHTVSVLLHVVTTLFLWRILRRLNLSAAWLAAALFAVNPFAVETVAQIESQSRLWAAALATVGMFRLLNAFLPKIDSTEEAAFEDDELPPPDRRRQFRHVVAIVTGMAAMIVAALCQPSAAVLSVAMVLLVAWRRPLSNFAWLLIGVTVVACGFAAWLGLDPHTIAESIAASTHRRVLAAAMGIGVVGVVALFLLRRRIGAGPFVAASCLLILLPTAMSPPAFRLPIERIGLSTLGYAGTYLCAIPLLVIAAETVYWLSLRLREHTQQSLSRLAVGAAALLAMAAVTVARVIPFRSNEGLLQRDLSGSGSIAAKARLANWYLSHNEPAKAAEQLAGQTPQTCTSAPAAIAAGDIQQASGNALGALDWYRTALRLDPGGADGTSRLGSLLAAQNRTLEAVECFEDALRRKPESYTLRNDLGLILLGQRQFDPAAEQFTAALKTDPDFVPAHVNLATALIEQGKLQEAAAELQKAVQLDPENADSFHNAGVVLAQLHDSPRSIKMLTTAVQLRPSWPEARNDLGVALVGAGRFKQAEYEFEQAIALNPQYDAARHNLAVARRRESVGTRPAE